METNRRFSLLAFPQFFDGQTLTLGIVVLPRNQNPLRAAIELNDPPIPDAPAFADATLSFEAAVITGLSRFPNNQLASRSAALATAAPAQARDLFVALAKNFKLDPLSLNQSNANLDANWDSAKKNAAVAQALSVKKYLPLTYRQAFNFTNVRTPNAATDDSYQCAVRDAGKVKGFQRSPDTISWGKVFAYALRQPLLARQLGMLYTASLQVQAADFPQGGWLYVDLAAGSDYKIQQQADDKFIKRYAARIPPLQPGTPRQLFAPVLFPVQYKAAVADPDPLPDGQYDQLFLEAAEYDDGFAKIVHAYQPHSRNLLAEESDGAHPVKDVGVRLGWDDEQILIWYMRQMMIDTSVLVNPDKRIDAPLGVFGYAVDVRDAASAANPWESLNGVRTRQPLAVSSPPGEPVGFAEQDAVLELPFQVYPAQIDGDPNQNYWLPMYFAHWNGHSLVLPDQDAAEIYQTTHPNVQPDPEDPVNDTGTGVSGPAQNQLNQIYAPDGLTTTLRYGHAYDFRVRLRDLSGGGPPLAAKPINAGPADKARTRFRRYVAPNQVRVQDLPVNTDTPSALNQLTLRRPLLNYPAVAYTGKYADPVARLKAASVAMQGKEAFGIADPDVSEVEIAVEVQTLRMDNLLSLGGQDNYVHLYNTRRAFPPVNGEDDYEAALGVPIVYRDCHVLHVGDELNLANDLQLPNDIDQLAEIVLPTARTIRLTVRAVCEDKAENSEYYGLLNDADHEQDVRFGHILQIQVYQPSADETDLFVAAGPSQTLQGIWLQPDPPAVYDGKLVSFLIGPVVERPPDAVQRLAKQLKLESSGLTLTGSKGERVQFGCSNRIRHTLSPDASSLTFATKGDLSSHWLCALSLTLDRDWTWDALQDRSLVITRTVRFTRDDPATETETLEVGAIELRHTAAFEMLQNPQRNFTRLLFLDAVEPKNARKQPPPHASETRFPDTIEVHYDVAVRFKAGHGAQQDAPEPREMSLPITTPPAQIPKIASAGLALSPYRRNAKYSATEPRQRYLWIEFEEPVQNPDDAFFARVLQYAPDQLISNNEPDLLAARPEPALPIDPELTRVIPPGATNDLAGLNAMQPMEKAADSDRHYLLPLPPGLHADAAELFGFFTYEFRVGHYRNRDTQAMVWTTAQGRFGRPLRATGLQHPAPTLTCAASHDEDKLFVTAPYATAVFEGKNVTADPPRTELWCLLYAQVKQADNQDFRNILLDDRRLDWRVQIEPDRDVNWLTRYDDQERRLLKNITVRNWKDDLSYGQFQHVFKLAETATVNKDATRYGTVVWSAAEVRQLLELYGLPVDSPLSVLVVEILPTITNIYEHLSGLGQAAVQDTVRTRLGVENLPEPGVIKEQFAQLNRARDAQDQPSPLSDELGQHRILRTSPLTEVPFVCA